MPQQSWNEETLNPPSNSPQKGEPSPYQVMLQSAPLDYLTNLEGATHELPPEYPVYYFFYGTLTVAANLKRIIDLQEEPRLRKAKIIGYTLAKWGDYPALINGEPGQEVSGYAYLVQSEEEAQSLLIMRPTHTVLQTAGYSLRMAKDHQRRPARHSFKQFTWSGLRAFTACTMDFDPLAQQQSDRIFQVWIQNWVKHSPEELAGKLASRHCPGTPATASRFSNGAFNICYRVSFKEGLRLLVRFTALGRVIARHEKVKDEVAVMEYVVKHTEIPVPNVLGSGTCVVGPYIVTDFIDRNPLSEYL
ncbi:hypothetical protein CNMCM7691_006622 [Aspergillus felis]|uniref:Gamma-glutamylcyclotransferase AIG2-like domain-containing protein n=1 Tax=Aspergillus felis TaxID=1287682 RepID=A0A8H6QU54_9EURO|nr:hypothetical protein CNMCM7691_006622 [Aspergillus felis]